MTIEDIRGEEIVKICNQKDIAEQYKGILINNGVPKEDIYRILKMYLVSERITGERTLLSTILDVNKDLEIKIKMDALESRINKIYVTKTTLANNFRK